MRLPGLPSKIPLYPSSVIHIQAIEAIRLIASRRAREVYDAAGSFIGIELGHFGPVQTTPHAEPLPPVEVENCKFVLASADKFHKTVMEQERLKHWPIYCVLPASRESCTL